MNEVEISALEEKWSRWKRPIQYVTRAAFILILYVFIYPAILLYFDNNETTVDEAPEVISDTIYFPAIPIEYLYEHLKTYKTYIDWLDEMMSRP
ncbi:MAG: hypothetical protein ACKVJU_24485 [Verrucomicrobiales bacterium]